MGRRKPATERARRLFFFPATLAAEDPNQCFRFMGSWLQPSTLTGYPFWNLENVGKYLGRIESRRKHRCLLRWHEAGAQVESWMPKDGIKWNHVVISIVQHKNFGRETSDIFVGVYVNDLHWPWKQNNSKFKCIPFQISENFWVTFSKTQKTAELFFPLKDPTWWHIPLYISDSILLYFSCSASPALLAVRGVSVPTLDWRDLKNVGVNLLFFECSHAPRDFSRWKRDCYLENTTGVMKHDTNPNFMLYVSGKSFKIIMICIKFDLPPKWVAFNDSWNMPGKKAQPSPNKQANQPQTQMKLSASNVLGGGWVEGHKVPARKEIWQKSFFSDKMPGIQLKIRIFFVGKAFQLACNSMVGYLKLPYLRALRNHSVKQFLQKWRNEEVGEVRVVD